MVVKFRWLLVVLALFLVACEGGFQQAAEDDDSGGSGTGGSTTTDQGVVISLGTGAGSSFSAGNLTLGAPSISAGGQTSVSVNVVDSNDANALYSGVPVTVEFASACTESDKATFSNRSVVTSSGTATTTYQAEGCVGNDVITATVGDSIARSTVTVNPADVGTVSYQGADVTSIAYDSYWGVSQPSIAKLTFVLKDDRGNPVFGQNVSFSLTTELGGIFLSTTSASSNENGEVSTRVNAGTVATSVRVVATFTAADGTEISTVSYPIAVNSGPADQDSFSTAASVFAPEAWNINGTEVDISIVAGDHHNNPVPDGTQISFWTEYGIIHDTCTTLEGECSVKWVSGGDRMATPDDDNLPIDGFTTIVAFTAGEDSFYETGEANGLFDDGETFMSTPERFYDRNKNGVFDAGFEEYFDYDGNNTFYDGNAATPLFRGYSCTDAAKAAGHCATAIEVWDDIEILMAGPAVSFTLSVAQPVTGVTIFSVNLADVNGNQPPAGTTLKADTSYGTVTIIGADEVPDGKSNAGFNMTLLFEPDPLNAGSGYIVIEAETPSGVKTGTTIAVQS